MMQFYKSDLVQDGLLDTNEIAASVVGTDARFEILRYCLEQHSNDEDAK